MTTQPPTVASQPVTAWEREVLRRMASRRESKNRIYVSVAAEFVARLLDDHEAALALLERVSPLFEDARAFLAERVRK